MATREFELSTRLAPLKNIKVVVSAPKSLAEEQWKKRARVAVSQKHTSKKIGFMHAVMIEVGGEYFLLAGGSGMGKSTLAHSVLKQVRGSIAANDWVAVERVKDSFYASDVNFRESIAHKTRCKLRGIVFITRKDSLKRDIHVPNNGEFNNCLAQAFDGIPDDTVSTLSSFWIANKDALPFYCTLSREKGITYTTNSLITALKRLRPVDAPIQVGVIGIGSVGIALANELGRYNLVQNVHLYNRTKQAVSGLAMDLNQSLKNGRSDVYIAHDSVKDLFRRSSVVFLTYREKDSPVKNSSLPERWGRVDAHAKIMHEYAKLAAQAGFSGTTFVVTNPVDFLTFAFYKSSQKMSGEPQRTFQVYGVGLEGDLARAIFYGRNYDPSLTANDIRVYGNHADNFILDAPLNDADLASLHSQVIDASREVRSHAIRTVFGPVAAAIRSFEAYLQDGSTHLSVIQEGAYIGRKLTFKFSLPCFEPISPNAQTDYEQIISSNKQRLKEFRNLVEPA